MTKFQSVLLFNRGAKILDFCTLGICSFAIGESKCTWLELQGAKNGC
jgi:hypothetical protein